MSEPVEVLAEALFARDHVAYSETAHPDHNRWSWRGDGHDEAYKNEWRELARAAITAMGLHEETCCEGIRAEQEETGKYSVYTCADVGRSCRMRLVGPWSTP